MNQERGTERAGPGSAGAKGSEHHPNPPTLVDFGYPGSQAPHGVIEEGAPVKVLHDIAASAAAIEASLVGRGDLRFDCRHACHRWQLQLRRFGHLVRQEGGVGIDEDAFTSDYCLIAPALRSGYREGDGLVHRHFWLLVGVGCYLFDPTAHQFDAKGGLELDRYLVDGVASFRGRCLGSGSA